jgi:predicted AlkP superfamily phosphohydrolase/phosphomutase
MGRTVIVGLDAFHEALLEFTPYIQSLYNNNLSGRLESTLPPVTAPAWASFQTGKNQGKHGVYDFITFDTDFEAEFLNGTALRAKPFYEALDEQGFDCFLFNLPFSMPARIKGDVTPSWLDADDCQPTPANLYDTYDIHSPKYPALEGTRLDCIREIQDTFGHNRDQFLEVLRADDHDFLFQLISETDWIQHKAYLDLIRNPETKAAKIARQLLTEVDEYIKTLDEMLTGDDTLILMSDHGFKIFERQFYVNDWLESNGYLTFGDTYIGSKSETGRSVNTGGLGRWLFHQEWLHPILRPLKNVATRHFGIEVSYDAGIDIEQSSAFCRSKDESAIRLSPHLTEDERERIMNGLLDDFSDVPGIHAYQREDVYEGPNIDKAGEIILSSEKCKLWRGPVGQIWRENPKAHHSPDGLFIAAGIPPGNNEPVRASLLDIAPTVLAYHGVPIPENVDGDVLSAFPTGEPEYVTTDDYFPEFGSNDGLSHNDVQQRLEDLGYM